MRALRWPCLYFYCAQRKRGREVIFIQAAIVSMLAQMELQGRNLEEGHNLVAAAWPHGGAIV
jgi:hypothetical protein